MRVGSNPEKANPVLPTKYGAHRVIIPVYIPEEAGYFEKSRLVVEQCLASLIASTERRAAITVVVNAATTPTMKYLESLHARGELDQLIVNHVNRGKVDAVVSAMRASYEPFLTVTDSDVYFYPRWLRSVEEVFAAFPESGFVSAFPCVHLAWHCTSSTVLGALLRGELRRENRVSEADMDLFAHGIGNDGLILASHRRAQWVVKRKGFYACVGASHMQFTMRREVVAAIPAEPALEALSGSTDRRWLDEPVDRAGLWRLSTIKAYVEHIGNVPIRGKSDKRPSPDEPPRTSTAGEMALPGPRISLAGRLPTSWRRKGAGVLRRISSRL